MYVPCEFLIFIGSPYKNVVYKSCCATTNNPHHQPHHSLSTYAPLCFNPAPGPFLRTSPSPPLIPRAMHSTPRLPIFSFLFFLTSFSAQPLLSSPPSLSPSPPPFPPALLQPADVVNERGPYYCYCCHKLCSMANRKNFMGHKSRKHQDIFAAQIAAVMQRNFPILDYIAIAGIIASAGRACLCTKDTSHTTS